MTVLTSTFVPHPLPEVDAHGLVVRSTPAPLPEGPSTVSACLEAGRRDHPDRPALVWNDSTLTYSELDTRVAAAAGALASLGIGPGDRVACSLPNRPALVEAFLATQRLGAVWLGINTNLVADEAHWLLDDAGARLLITDPDRLAIGGGRLTIAVDPTTAGGADDEWGVLLDAGLPAPTVEVDPQAPAAIAYTSGTTGLPKGVVLAQRTTEHRVLWLSTQAGVRHGTHNRTLGFMPLSHAIGFFGVFLVTLALDGTYFVMSAFDPAAAVETIEREGITYLFGIPTLFHAMTNVPIANKM